MPNISLLQVAPSGAPISARVHNFSMARQHYMQLESHTQLTSLASIKTTSNLYQVPLSVLKTSESQHVLPMTSRVRRAVSLSKPTHKEEVSLVSPSIGTQAPSMTPRGVISLDKSFLEANHPSNLSNKSISSAGTCGSDIGYASTTSSEHVSDTGILSDNIASTTSSEHINDSGTLSDATTSSNDVRCTNTNQSMDKFKQSNPRQASIEQQAQKRRPCRSLSPTPSPKESAVPVPTRLCSRLALSPRKDRPSKKDQSDCSFLDMPKAKRTWQQPDEEEDALSRPEELDKMYPPIKGKRTWRVPDEEQDALSRPEELDKVYNVHSNDAPGLTTEDAELSTKVSDALREAEVAREFAMAALGRCKRTARTPGLMPDTSQLGSATPRWSIPSIWDSGQVHSDLLSWFADELGVSKDAAADISEGLMESCRDHPLTSRSTTGSPVKQSSQPCSIVSSIDDSSTDLPMDLPTRHAPQPCLQYEREVMKGNIPFASPSVNCMDSEDSFAPEPRMLADPAARKASSAKVQESIRRAVERARDVVNASKASCNV